MINTDLVLDVAHNLGKNLNKIIYNRNFDEYLEKANEEQIFKAYLAGMIFKVSLDDPEYIKYFDAYNKKTAKIIINATNKIVSKNKDLFDKYTFKTTNAQEFKKYINKNVLKKGTKFVPSKNIALAADTDKVIKLIYNSGVKLSKGDSILHNIYKTYYEIDLFSKRLYLKELLDANGRYTEIAALMSGIYLAYEKLIEKLHDERLDDSRIVLEMYESAQKKLEEDNHYKEYFEQCRIFFKNICQDGSVFYEVLEDKSIEEYFMFTLLAEEHIESIKEKFARFDRL